MIMILFGALSAGTKTYLLCRSDRHAFTSTFCNTLPVGCLKFCFNLKIPSSIWPFTISFQDDRTESSTISRLAHCNAYWSTAHTKVINFYPDQLCMALCIRAFCNQISQFGIWNEGWGGGGVGVWGCGGVWVCGCVGVWVCGCGCGWVWVWVWVCVKRKESKPTLLLSFQITQKFIFGLLADYS